MALPFWKLSGAGNDFVIVNNMDGVVTSDVEKRGELVRTLCARRVGVGADGVLLTEPSEALAFRMRYYNADGGEVDTCGNGARCIARFAHMNGIADAEMDFETLAGPYHAVVKPDAVTISMSDAHSLDPEFSFQVAGLYDGPAGFVNTGVEHVVIVVDDIEKVPVVELGRAIRHHDRYAPKGTNANFIAPSPTPEDPKRLAIRTYERGVEDETLACGTGCIASGIIASLRGMVESPVSLLIRGGVVLTVHFERTDTGACNVRLEGEARVVYRGEVDV